MPSQTAAWFFCLHTLLGNDELGRFSGSAALQGDKVLAA